MRNRAPMGMIAALMASLAGAALAPVQDNTTDPQREFDRALRRSTGRYKGDRYKVPKQSKQSKNQAKASRRKNRGK